MNQSQLQSIIEDHISESYYGSAPATLYEPIHYIMSLGGKRLRPILTLMGYSLYKNDLERVVPYATAVELFHNFTLMHDDIMDKAPLRRSMKTVHEKWNVSTAILSGDAMLVKVYEIFSSLESKQLKEVLSLFNQCATEVCEGQQWDMEFQSISSVSAAQYLEMIRLKTAVLLGFSLELGAVMAGAKTKDCEALRNLGINIGIGFQLKDDLLDVYGDPKKFGKQIGGDIIENKKTFLLIKALERATGKNQKELQRWLKATKFDKKKKVKAVTTIYDDLNLKTMTEEEISKYFNKGLDNLQKLKASHQRDELSKFIIELINRQY